MARNFVAASSQYLTRASGMPVAGGDWTASTWINTNQHNNNVCLMIGGGATLFAYLVVNSGGSVGLLQSDGAGGSASASTIATTTLGKWHHVAGTLGNASRAVYLDGSNKVTNATALTSHTLTGPLSIGRYDDGAGTTGNYFDGSIAETAIWNVQLSDDEIATLGRGHSPLLVRRSALVAYWSLRNGESPERDAVTGAFTLTLVNGPAFTGAHPPMIPLSTTGGTRRMRRGR